MPMAGAIRQPPGLQAKKQAMPPPNARPATARAQSSAPYLSLRKESGTVSPTESIASMPSIAASSMSPTLRSAGGSKRKEREFEGEGEETNIHVVVRCRGRNEREVRENSGVVVSTDGVKGKKVELSMGANALSNKIYHFDKVFSPAADQSMIYEDVVTPILGEVMIIKSYVQLQSNFRQRCCKDTTVLSSRTGRLALVKRLYSPLNNHLLY